MNLLGSLLDQLAARDDLQVIFSPREPSQAALLDGRAWKVSPVVLLKTVPMVPLIKAVDWVVTGGGTMVREAAWLGVPGVTIFTGESPAVDEWLEQQGVLMRILEPKDVESVDWTRPSDMGAIEHHPEAIDSVADIVLSRSRNR